ncbi:ester cyclase [Parasulfitobacter algicola]|uniref:Ester cyclase n=1 Tax=Parasulfitobacter algicola TaxID=2614809 RepID=A0ABX2IRJ7_9RHOB|nr:ester cyclase [Sulfitobacter algicola]NSX54641.1 ester cyclase [Sulfitobacter algicola]
MTLSAALKDVIAPLQGFEESTLQEILGQIIAPGATIHMCHPFGTLQGSQPFYNKTYKPLLTALPDLERRDMIVLAGTTPEGQDWVGTCGNYMGTFTHPFLDILPTGHLVHMRYHEFFRIKASQIVEIQAIWDIPELMMQAAAWPLAPQLGRFMTTPAPASQDGLTTDGDGNKPMQHVLEMLAAMVQHPSQGGPEIMKLPHFWHPHFNWYGPAGIGTCRGIDGFRNWHQIPFLNAMPDRALDPDGLMSHWIAQGQYVAETGWPNMRQTLSQDGWLGLPPTGQQIELRSLDFWRLENGLIRENWVLVDLLHVYDQIGIDVMARMREFNKAQNSKVFQ